MQVLADGGYGWAELNFCGQLSGTQRYWCNDPETSPNRCAGLMYAWPDALGGVAANVGAALGITTGTIGVTSTTSTFAVSATSSGTTSNRPTQSATSLPVSNTSLLPLAVGLGVGVPLCILALGVLIYLFRRGGRRNQNRDTRISNTASQPGELSTDSGKSTWIQSHELAGKQEGDGNAAAELPEQRYSNGRSH